MFRPLSSDVCAPVRGREPGPPRADLAAAEGEDPGHHRLVHAPVPRVRRQGQEAHQDLPQVLQEDQAHQGAGRHRHGQREYIQGSTNRRAPGLVNFVPTLAYHFCLNLPAAFTQPGAHLLVKPCTYLDEVR